VTFLNAVFWEFIQNFPVILLFVVAVWLWAKERRAQAGTCAVSSGVIGSLVIRFTEPMASGYTETWTITWVNAVTMSLLQVLFAAYLGSEANWSNWKVDLGLGGLAGVSLAVAQGLASQGSPLIGVVLHSIALAVGGALVLVGIRKLKNESLVSALASAILLVIVMTLFISAIDYGYFLFG
jgi:hypothetical protein